MKKVILVAFLLPSLKNIVSAQDKTDLVKHKFELKLSLDFQRPFFTDSHLKDIGLPKQYRYRSGVSIGLRYHFVNRWFVEYQAGFSPEGGGFNAQFTNVNYFKNTLLVGYTASHARKYIFSIYTGLSFSYLLSANFKNKPTGTHEAVNSFFAKKTFAMPLGIDLKRKIKDNYYLGIGTYVVTGLSVVSKNTFLDEFQYIIPAFKLSLSKLIH